MNKRIFNVDCVEFCQGLPDNHIDLVVTSPPYDDLRGYDGYEGYNFKGLVKELYRVIKDGGVVVWVVADQTINGSETGTSFRQALYFMEVGFNLHDTMIYQRTSQYPANVRYQQDFEFMFVFSKGQPKTINILREKKSIIPTEEQKSRKVFVKTYRQKDGSLEVLNKKGQERFAKAQADDTKARSNIWKISAGYMSSTTDEFAFEHPAIFPEELAKDHILSWSSEGDLVYDPFLGSGTTGKMAEYLNRKFIGTEISEEYCKIAQRRMSQTNLFME